MKKHFITITLFSLLLLGCAGENDKTQSYIEVAGYAEQEVEPDIFYLNFTLSENNSAKININDLEKKIVDNLTALNIDIQQDLSVTSLYGDNWSWWRKRKNVYQNKSYSLKINNLDLLNKVCDKLDALGYNSYYLAKTDNSNSEQLKNEIQQAAVKNARAKAENLLAGENKKVGELLYLQENMGDIVFAQNRLYENKLYDSEMSAPAVNFKRTVGI